MLGLPIGCTVQGASLADGKTHFDICGEVHTTLYKNAMQCELDALVVRELGVDVLAGNSFLVSNLKLLGVTLDFANRRICMRGRTFPRIRIL